MKCPQCGTEFSALREFCPKCGASSDPVVHARRRAASAPPPGNLKRNRNRVLMIGAGLLASAVVLSNAFDDDSDRHDRDRQEQVEVPTANASVEIEADALYRAYREDPEAADRRFEDREMVVTGEFLRIVPDGYGSLDLRLKTSNPDVPIGVDVAELALDEAKRLRPGQRVTVSCQRMGGHDDELWVRDCAVQSVADGTAAPSGSPPAPESPAAPEAPASSRDDANG